MKVSSLHIYPIKSCRGVSVKSFRLDTLGPLFDRRYMLVDDSGCFMSQREHPRMALIRPILAPTGLKVEAKGMPRLTIQQRRDGAQPLQVEILNNRGPVHDGGEEAASWFSDFLQTSCRLAALPGLDGLPVDRKFARFEALTAFTDGFPLLLIAQASLDDLNGRLQRPVTMDRFRPNVVVQDCEAFAEDGWDQIRMGETLVDVVKPCSRCVMTTVDQTNAEKGKEPLATLASYRTVEGRIMFGQNGIHHGAGHIRVGDDIQVMARATS